MMLTSSHVFVKSINLNSERVRKICVIPFNSGKTRMLIKIVKIYNYHIFSKKTLIGFFFFICYCKVYFDNYSNSIVDRFIYIGLGI